MLLKFSLEIISGFTVEAFHKQPSIFDIFKNSFTLLFRCILKATVRGGQNEKNAAKEGNAQPLWKIVLTVLILVKHDPEYLSILGSWESFGLKKKANKEDVYHTNLHKKCTLELTLVAKERTRRLGQTWKEG